MMKKQTMRVLGLCAAICAAGCALSGCGTDGKPADTATEEFTFTQYPIETDTTLKYWVSLNGNLLTTVKNLSETPFAAELEKQTGVKLEFIHPAAGQGGEQFNLMLASDDLPDLIGYNWYAVPGGPGSAISGGHIRRLNELIDEQSPNLKAYLEANPEIDKSVKTDDGSYYVYPFIRGDKSLTAYQGLYIRQDWLSELGLSMPETIDEWTNVLTQFKEKKGAKIPFAYSSTNPFCSAFGIKEDFYVDGDQIKYGPIEPEYKDYISKMREWYVNGLIDKNLATLQSTAIDADMLNGEAGASFGFLSGNLGRYLSAKEGKNETFDLQPAPYPTLVKGEKSQFGYRDLPYTSEGSVAISAGCKYPKLAARFLDYGYGEQGGLLYNFGIEGQSYTKDGGELSYTDTITNNPDGLAISAALSMYAPGATSSGPFIQDKRHVDLFYVYPQQKAAVEVWSDTEEEAHMLPKICPTQEESGELSKIKNEMATYRSEMFMKFLMGVEPLENFDSYVEQMKKLGVDRAIEIEQAALDRYNSR